MAELTTTQAEEILATHNFIDRGGAQKEAEGIRFRLFSVGTQSNLLLEVGSDKGIRVLLSTKMEPLVERLKGSGDIVVDESKDFSLAKDEAVKFEIERRGRAVLVGVQGRGLHGSGASQGHRDVRDDDGLGRGDYRSDASASVIAKIRSIVKQEKIVLALFEPLAATVCVAAPAARNNLNIRTCDRVTCGLVV